MDTKTYLSQVWNIDRRIKDKIKESERWMDIAYSRSAGKTKQIKHDTIQTSHDCHDQIADAIAISVTFYQEAVKMSEELLKKKHLIQNQISAIENDDYYNVLHAYYVDHKTLREISDDENYSEKSAKRRYESAILRFEEKFGSTYL